MSTERPTWDELSAKLAELRAALPQLLKDYPDPGDCLEAFAGEVESITERAEYDDDLAHAFWVAKIDLLIEFGLVPPEERQN